MNPIDRNELIIRIQSITGKENPTWGKMNVYQMIKHGEYWERWIQGNDEFDYKQSILGILLGKWMLHRTLKNEKPLAKNIPTSEPFIVREKSGDLEASKQQ